MTTRWCAVGCGCCSRRRATSTSSARPATSTARWALAGADSPDVILLDLNMPGRPSLPAIPELLEASPGGAVVVMTQHDDPEFARVALSGGASGFVLKEAAHSELVEAVRAAVAGRTYLNPSLGARLAAVPAAKPPTTRSWRSARRSPGIASTRSRGAEGWAWSTSRPTSPSTGRSRSSCWRRAWPATGCSARASSASAGSPRRSTIRTSSRSSTRASSAGRSTSPCATSTAPTCGRCWPRRGGSSPHGRSRSSPRSPTRWAPRTGAGSSTATSSPPTSSSRRAGGASTRSSPTSGSRWIARPAPT